VLDKQVIDIARKKAVRVNDVCLRDDWHILGIDSSTLGLVRRIAEELRDKGSYEQMLDGQIPYAEINAMLAG